MIKIDQEKCIGCGACVDDCFTRDLVIEEDKAKVLNQTCIKCGHCIAICPVNAVSITDYDMSEVKAYNAVDFDIEPEKLLNFIKFRRSVRQFTEKPIEKEKLEAIIEAGRFTPTGGNRQPVSFVVVQNELSELTRLALESLNNQGQAYLADKEKTPPLIAYYAKRWLQMYEDYLKNPEKPTDLFFNAKTVMIVVSESPIDGGLAASSMELMTHAQKLGMYYSGFFVRAAANSQELRRFLGIAEDNKHVIACLVMGYPEVSYKRTVPRKKPSVSWR
ncbi:nitroreductase family protein [Acetobacterium woodii]|uniref:Nitroreductase family protein fused to ferredoxin domain protein n=1 Tax=Acetobacterium woodii (strain ATCC 29683 / DSM 1030 / JCM 2381 / KCTC 1655 / WB1) TaxID=931626 RepID=H6LJ26_ACEWD|nr:nitroreductase family protein [Acetobacterium woodii]AFA47389.1 nitroreductase family protein fused to ferredoxin domain protein [Acetobacterium woodii DSM 1030]